MLEKIISGGQTGADQAGALASRRGIWRRHRRRMPNGFLTEEGVRPEFAVQFHAVEMPTDSHPDRTEQNVQDSDGTVWFGETTTSGAQETVGACQRLGKPCLPVYPGASFEPAQVATWIRENAVKTLNVAGNRESLEVGIGDRVERFLAQVLQELGHARG